MAVLTLRIDGQAVAVPAGSSLLAATRLAGLALPVLCHLDGLTPVGACRLCLVAIEGQSKLQPACTSEALEGQVVATNTAELRELRRMAVELFFAEGNHVCAYCVASGACELQAMAVTVGMDHSRFPYQYPLRDVDASHPLFSLDANRCILCSRCVRVCVRRLAHCSAYLRSSSARSSCSMRDMLRSAKRRTFGSSEDTLTAARMRAENLREA